MGIDCVVPGSWSSYRGTVSLTQSDKTCQRWDRQTPHEHKYTPSDYPASGLEQNYCREPEGNEPRLWCYTTDPGTRWNYCDVPFCETGWCFGNDFPCDDGVCINGTWTCDGEADCPNGEDESPANCPDLYPTDYIRHSTPIIR
uniref:Kringle domain-containing protein n=1 Tax=Branchiostoma floridae TaxID=7739 RepID=C3YHB9_BRAFL|eukprot:XP_002604344.1 hypothetical protein BRAFLDRAFT_85434 [Branchiostoma floridae]